MEIMEIMWIVIICIFLIGFMIFGFILLFSLQKLVMKLEKKIFHFVPVIFYITQFIYGILGNVTK